MKKIFVILVTLVVVSLSIGCGANDKFVGRWVGICGSMEKDPAIAVYDIKKNGESYIVDAKIYFITSGSIIKYESDKEYSDIWNTNHYFDNVNGNVNGNSIVIPGMLGNYNIVYIEDEKKIQSPQLINFPKAILELDNDSKKFEQYKKEITEKQKSKMEKKYPGIKYTVKDSNNK